MTGKITGAKLYKSTKKSKILIKLNSLLQWNKVNNIYYH